MQSHRPCESRRTGEQALLQQQGHEVGCLPRTSKRLLRKSFAADRGVLLEQGVDLPLMRRVLNGDLLNESLRVERSSVRIGQLRLQPPYQDLLQGRRLGCDPSGKSLRIEHRQQCRPRFGVAVVRRRREEQAVLAVR